MQLMMLAPASNLVTSVTAALMPTLLGPATNMATRPIPKPGMDIYTLCENFNLPRLLTLETII